MSSRYAGRRLVRFRTLSGDTRLGALRPRPSSRFRSRTQSGPFCLRGQASYGCSLFIENGIKALPVWNQSALYASRLGVQYGNQSASARPHLLVVVHRTTYPDSDPKSLCSLRFPTSRPTLVNNPRRHRPAAQTSIGVREISIIWYLNPQTDMPTGMNPMPPCAFKI